MQPGEANSIQNQANRQSIENDIHRTNPSWTLHQAKVDSIFAELFESNKDSEVDKAYFSHGYFQSSTIGASSIDDEQKTYTRVVKDKFHLRNMVKPCKCHESFKGFMYKFRDTLFELGKEDKRSIE